MTDKIGILDPKGINPNPLTNEPYSETYKSLAKFWSGFPAYEKAKEILDSMATYQITFIVSGTGSGKTVLIPKLALHYLHYQGKIAITLPKRILTLSAATFAAQTLDVELGTHVGYLYKGSDKKVITPENKLVYMTDGSLIMKIVKDPLLSEYDIIIIDEAHERKVQIDLLLLFIKQILKSGKRPDLRLIIMSATIDAEKYQSYYSDVSSNLIHISGQPNHPIVTYFLSEPVDSYMAEGSKLIEKIIKDDPEEDILFFITTSAEALQLCRIIRPKYPKVYCIEVYADMSKDLKIYAESRDKYLELGNYDQKLIIATNVAESSVTIDGLKYVIDSGYELFSYFDPEAYGQVLEKRLISRAQALQRRGRVGRTEPGICYHLLTEKQFENLAPYPEPDILKQDITLDMIKMILLTHSKTYQNGLKLLNQLMDVPKKAYIESARNLLQLYRIIGPDKKLTKLGMDLTHFSALPLNRSLFLLYSYQLHCAKEASIIVAMTEVLDGKISNLFLRADTIAASGYEKDASRKLIEKLVQKKGDHLTFLNIFQKFKEAKDQQAWVRKYGLRINTLNTINKTSRKYFRKVLSIYGIPQFDRVKKVDVKKRIVEALELSHQHLIAKKLVPIYAKKKIEGQINKESAVHYHYSKKSLAKKTFVYDELVNINRNWEYNVVTLIN